MNKSLARIIVGCMGIGLCISCSGPEKKASKLLTEASQLAQSAREAEQTSYSDALKLYQDSLTKAEAIPTQYPSSQVATKLAQGEVKIGSYTLTDLRGTIVPQAQLKAEAEESPLACALLVARTIEEPTSRAIVMAEIATKYADAGQLERVLQILKKTRDKESRNRVLSEMIGRHLHPDLYDQALRIANSVGDDPTLKDWASAWIARDAASRGQSDKAVEVAKTLEVASSKAEALVGVAGYCMSAGQREKAAETLSQALEVAETIEEASHKDWALGQIARGYAELGQYDRALAVTGKITKNSADSADTLAEIARSEAKAGHYDQAVTVTLSIVDPSVQYRTLADIADTCIVSGDKAKTAELLGQLLQSANAIEERSLLEGQVRRRFLRWHNPVEALQSHPVKARALAEVAGKYAKIGGKAKATELLSQALAATNAVENAYPKADALAEIAETYAAVGEYDRASQAASTISDNYFRAKALAAIAGFKAQALATIASHYAEVGQYDQALQLAHTIEDPHFQSEVLVVVTHKYVEAGQYDHALQLARTIPDDALRQGVLAEVADGYRKAGQPEQAAGLLSESQVNDDRQGMQWEARYEAIADMAALYASAGLSDVALRIANKIDEAAKQANALAAVARKFAGAGQKEKAAETFSRALEVAKTLEGDFRERTLAEITGKYTEAGQHDQAVQTAETVDDASSRASALIERVRKYADTGQYDQALQAAQSIEDSPAKVEALLAIARKYAEAGAEEKATEISIQALWIANSAVEDDSDAAWTRAWALRQVADEYLGDKQYDQAFAVAKTMKDDTPKAGVLAGIASKYAEEGARERAAELLSQALQIARMGESAESRAQALAAIGFLYAKAGLKVDDSAKKILHDMVAELGESVWHEQPSEAEEQKARGYGWGIVDGDATP
jgi:tetratricopeptide (TPR) repeat protein